jgi:hypothetical protein
VPFTNHIMQHFGEKSCMLVNVNTQKLPWPKEETCLSNVNHGKVFPLLESPSSQPPCEMK